MFRTNDYCSVEYAHCSNKRFKGHTHTLRMNANLLFVSCKQIIFYLRIYLKNSEYFKMPYEFSYVDECMLRNRAYLDWFVAFWRLTEFRLSLSLSISLLSSNSLFNITNIFICSLVADSSFFRSFHIWSTISSCIADSIRLPAYMTACM